MIKIFIIKLVYPATSSNNKVIGGSIRKTHKSRNLIFKKLFIFFVLLNITISCNLSNKKSELLLEKSKNKTGIGLIHFNYSHPILFYKTDTDLKPYDELNFEKVIFGINKGKYNFITSRLGNILSPYTMNGGDTDSQSESNIRGGLIRLSPQLIFRVIERKNNGFVVIINEKTFETSFIKTDFKNNLRKNSDPDQRNFDPNFVDSKISNWFYYETWEQALKRAWNISYDMEDIYNKPNGVKIKSNTDFNQIDSVYGDWARLIERNNRWNKNYVWIKWKENDSLKIDLILNGGYD